MGNAGFSRARVLHPVRSCSAQCCLSRRVFVTGFVTGAATRRIAGFVQLNDFLQTPLGGALVALVVGILLLGSAPFWWRPLKAWWWRRAVKGLPDYVRVRSERYVGASRILGDRVR